MGIYYFSASPNWLGEIPRWSDKAYQEGTLKHNVSVMQPTMVVQIAYNRFFLLLVELQLHNLGDYFFPMLSYTNIHQRLSIQSNELIIMLNWEIRGFSRSIRINDGNGTTLLHLTTHRRWGDCVHVLLSSRAFACASTGRYRYTFNPLLLEYFFFNLSFLMTDNSCSNPSSASLHLASRDGYCVQELLAWGADHLQRESFG